VNVAAHLAQRAAAEPDRAALHVPTRRGHDTVTFADMHSESDALAHGLAGRGVTRGVRVAVMVPPSLPFFAVTFALLKLAAVPVLIDPGMGLTGLGRCLTEADPAAFIGVPKAHAARRLFGWARRSVVLTVNAGESRFFCHASTEELAITGWADGPFEMPEVEADDTAAVLFTSGSTGPAKGVVYTHGTFTAQVELLKRVYGITPGEVDLCTFPLFALFGPALGMTCVIPRMDPTRPARADPRVLMSQANEFGVTNLFGSPAVLRNWAAANVPPVPTLKRVISAGAPATAVVIAAVAERLPAGAEVFTPYGATEALPVANIGSRELAETRAATESGRGVCVGRPVPGVMIQVVAQSTEPIAAWDEALALPVGQIGEFVVRGPVVTREYFRRPEATRLAKIPDPATGEVWHRMGDVGYFDEHGRMWFCGRKAHVVWTAAGPLYPDQVEPVLNLAEGVSRTALVGVTRGGVTYPVVCVELVAWAEQCLASGGYIHDAVEKQAAKLPHAQTITTFIEHTGFPVDVRHNSKIFREKLAAWADRTLLPDWPS